MKMSKYTTKDSGKRLKYSSGMIRDVQDGKPRFDLIIPKDFPYNETMLYRWADLLSRGMTKYGYRNWERAETEEELIRFKDSTFRHFIQWFCGMDDEDHAAAVLFNIQGVEYVKYKLYNGKDKYGQNSSEIQGLFRKNKQRKRID